MMGTVRAIAARLARRLPQHIDREDLIGAGSLGLADALSRRGTMPGPEFEAFAACRIRGAMLDELRRIDSMTRGARRASKRVSRARHAVEQRLGRTATEKEVAQELGVDLETYRSICVHIDANRAPVFFSALENDDGSTDVCDVRNLSFDAPSVRAELSAIMWTEVNALPERLRAVLVGLYVEGKTMKEIGASLGVTESRVCQLHGEALNVLRSNFKKAASSE
jgi:RNA polymerase sigma factor for flagellar operon FliA